MSIVFWRLNSAGKPNGVMGVPADYKPALLPMSPIPSNGGNASDPNFANFDTNNVFITRKNGSQVRTNVDHPDSQCHAPDAQPEKQSDGRT